MTIVPDGHVDMYRRFYEYDRTPLNARVDRVDESAPEWRKETVSLDAAYGGERVPAFLFLPRSAKPPYQTVVLFPSAYAVVARSSRELDLRTFDFIVRSGRAVLYPVYKGTFERQTGEISGPAALRDVTVQRAKDLFRAVDYLASRPDIYGYDALAWCLYRNGRYDEAAAAIEKALALDTGDATLLAHAGLIDYRRGRSAGALEYLTAANGRAPSLEDVFIAKLSGAAAGSGS